MPSPKKVLYDDPQFNYLKFWSKRQYENLSEKIAISDFLRKIASKNLLIDVGGGYGRNIKFLAKFFKKCILTDPSDKQLKTAIKKAPESNVDLVKAYAQKLPFPNETFNAALLIRVIHHLENPEAALKEISRILKKEGALILEFANKNHFRAIIKNLLSLNFFQITNIKPVKISQNMPKSDETIVYLNFHPKYIEKILKKTGFKIIDRLSVSNLRSQTIKKILPMRAMLFIETLFQKSLAKFYFGPSVFVLAKKTD